MYIERKSEFGMRSCLMEMRGILASFFLVEAIKAAEDVVKLVPIIKGKW